MSAQDIAGAAIWSLTTLLLWGGAAWLTFADEESVSMVTVEARAFAFFTVLLSMPFFGGAIYCVSRLLGAHAQ